MNSQYVTRYCWRNTKSTEHNRPSLQTVLPDDLATRFREHNQWFTRHIFPDVMIMVIMSSLDAPVTRRPHVDSCSGTVPMYDVEEFKDEYNQLCNTHCSSSYITWASTYIWTSITILTEEFAVDLGNGLGSRKSTLPLVCDQQPTYSM
jgi:hypothetical protein